MLILEPIAADEIFFRRQNKLPAIAEAHVGSVDIMERNNFMEISPKNVFWLRALRGEIYEMVKFDLYTFSTKFMLTPCMCGFMRYVLGRFQLIRSGQCGVCACEMH